MSRFSPHSCAHARAARHPARPRAAVGPWLGGLAVTIALQALWASVPGPRVALAQESPGPARPAPDAPRRDPVPAPGEGAGSGAGSDAGRDLDGEPEDRSGDEPGGGRELASEGGESQEGDDGEEVEDRADDEDTTGEPRPWAEGVSLERQSRARALYAEANALLHEYLLEEAMDKYREALAHWEHPAIHYHLARALDSLGRPLEADAHLVEALRYGEAAFARREYPQVLNFRRLLDQKLADVVILCEEEGVEIALDGKLIFTGPGRIERRVLPGEHLIVANKPGHAIVTHQLELARGHRTTVTLEIRQRWRPWEPWLVVGTGALVGATGAALQWQARDNLGRYRRGFEERCPSGCQDGLYPELAALRRRGRWQDRIGVTAMLTGGAVLVTGAILVVLNQSRSFRIDLIDRDPGLSVAPMVLPGGAGLTLDVDL